MTDEYLKGVISECEAIAAGAREVLRSRERREYPNLLVSLILDSTKIDEKGVCWTGPVHIRQPQFELTIKTPLVAADSPANETALVAPRPAMPA